MNRMGRSRGSHRAPPIGHAKGCDSMAIYQFCRGSLRRKRAGARHRCLPYQLPAGLNGSAGIFLND